MKIKKSVSRYVIPFYYECQNSGYERICNFFIQGNHSEDMLDLPNGGKWVEAGFWENYKSSNPKQAEMELHTYLLSIFKENKGDKRKDLTNLGNSFVYKTNGKILEMDYIVDKKRRIPIKCKDLGVLVLKNGIGFLWYEIAFKNDPDIGIYIDFQHDFKELARTHTTKFERKIGFDKEQQNVLYENFCLGKWFARFLDIKNMGIHFWAERNVSVKEDGIDYLPDKALLFQYLFVDEVSEEQCRNLVFQVANGYNAKYNAPNESNLDTYNPFGNTCFHISKAGMACVVANTESNEAFFEGQFKHKFIKDYFFLYLLLCYQTYSCAHYSRLLTELPADEKSYRKGYVFVKRLETLNSQVNSFLVKSVFDSVSNVHHQNEVYRYGKRALSINDDIQSLTIGLDALRDIEKDKHERKVNNALSIFGLLVVISALLDGVNFVDWIIDEFFAGNELLQSIGYVGIIAIIVFLAVYLIIVMFIDNRRNK